jgi:toxin ParE1/3/4
MKPIYQLSAKADIDLLSIYNFIAEHRVSAAKSYMELFYEKFELLNDFPDIGVKREDGTRFFPVDDYLITYRKKRHNIEIIRVLHSARKQSH